MQEEFKTMEDTLDHLKNYVNTRISQVKLDAAEKASEMISIFITRLRVAGIVFFFTLFTSLALASAAGDYFGKPWLGYAMMAAFYLVIGLIIWFSREKLLRIPIMNSIIARLCRENVTQYEKN